MVQRDIPIENRHTCNTIRLLRRSIVPRGKTGTSGIAGFAAANRLLSGSR
jgi:hypothetical protein